MFTCPENQTEYCCTHHDPKNHSHNIPAIHTSTQLPGLEMAPSMSSLKGGSGGFWFSFPKESQGVTWTEKTLRRIAGKCVGDAWRKDAGGCDECGEALDTCVADCIKVALCLDGNTDLLEATWDRVFADRHECPEVPQATTSQTTTTTVTTSATTTATSTPATATTATTTATTA